MDIKEMSAQELIERRAAIAGEIETADEARLDELTAEARSIKEELETRKAAEQKRAAVREAVASGDGETVRKFEPTKEKKMTDKEIRSSEAYINAYAEYIKTNDDRECRALMTNIAGGSVPVPMYVEDGIKAAWEKNALLQHVSKMNIRGVVGVGFEASATAAAVHQEGQDAPTEETLVIGTVQLIPTTIKKWLRITDEVAELAGRAFLDYIMDEITAKILAGVRGQIISAINAAPAASTDQAVGVAKITAAEPSLAIVAQAASQLGDDAENLCVIMNRKTHAAFVEQIAANGYMFDPFAGYTVIYDNHLAAIGGSAGTTVNTWLIVGDLSGVTVNFPGGEDVKLKYDDLTEAEADMVKIVGRLSVAVGVTGPGKLAQVVVS